MTRNSTLAVFFALVAAHVILAAAFATLTPFRTAGFIYIVRSVQPDIGAPDERQHTNYVLHLAHSGGFPVFNPKDPNLSETLESHQPPLFYVLDTAWGTVTGADLPPAPPASEGKAMSHDDGIKLRSLNVLIGAIGVGGVFMLAWWGFRRPEAALLAAAFAALLPMNIALSSAISNDPLLVCLCTSTLALAVHAVRDGWTTKLAIGIGVLGGLAILTKTTGVAVLPALLVAAFAPGASRPNAKQWIAALVPILLLVAPWWLRNQQLYGDPLAMRAFGQAFTGTAQADALIREVGPFNYWVGMVASWTVRSFVGVFGYMDIWLTNSSTPGGANSIYLVVWLLIGVAFVGWLLALRRAKGADDEHRGEASVHWVNGVFFVVVLFLFLRFNAQYFQAQGRYLLPALGPIACGVGLGLSELAKGRQKMALAGLILILGIADAFAVAKVPGEFQKRIELANRI